MEESLKNDIVYCKSLIRNLESELNRARRIDDKKIVKIKITIDRYNRVLEKLKTRYKELGARK